MVPLIRAVGNRALHGGAVVARKKGWISPKLGIRLLRDHRVSLGLKLASVGCGIALTVGLILLEIPLEAVVGAIMPLLGIALDITVDGLEFLVLPILFATLFIRWLAPKNVVEEFSGF